MDSRKNRWIYTAAAILFAAFCAFSLYFGVKTFAYRRPCREVVDQMGVEEALVYAVMKAESGFNEDAVSGAGAVGLMQLMPSTAEFVCRMNGIDFDLSKLKEGEYNTKLGCLYLKYLMKRFQEEETAVAAYNAGEGIVGEWLKDEEYSADGSTLKRIPYPETAQYVKKVKKFRKNYRFFYH